MSAREAIDGLIAELKSLGIAHAVWASDETLMVAIDPAGGDISLPETYMGWPITRVPWGAKKEPIVLRSDPPLPPTTMQGLAQFDRSLAVAVQDMNTEARKMGKLQQVAARAPQVVKELEARADKLGQRLDALEKRGNGAFDRWDGHLAEQETAVSAAEDAINQLSNGAPPLDDSATKPPAS